MSFGPVNPDCYGIGYNLLPDNILFICTTFNESTETNLIDFIEALQLSLVQMKKILTEEP